jgi:crossover junction endodeoxyribonuclease RuvC
MSTKLSPDRFMIDNLEALWKYSARPFVVGFDLSLTCTGISIMDRNFVLLYANTMIPPESAGVGVSRLQWYWEQMNGLLAKIYNAGGKDDCLIGIENYGFSEASPWTGELGGMVKMLMVSAFGVLNLTLIPPTSLKLFATGKGNSPKSVVMTHVLKRFGADFSNYGKPGEDMADAYAVARFTLSYWLWTQKLYTPLAYELKAFTPKPKKKRSKNNVPRFEEGLI